MIRQRLELIIPRRETTENIAANEPSDTISVSISGDDEPEEHETFTITLSNPSGATLLTNSIKGTITNDDGTKLSIADATLIEGADGATSKMQFTVSTFPISETEQTATWTTSIAQDDNATVGTDFTSASDTVRIAPNTQSGTFEVDIIGDDTAEFDETFTVTTICSKFWFAHQR